MPAEVALKEPRLFVAQMVHFVHVSPLHTPKHNHGRLVLVPVSRGGLTADADAVNHLTGLAEAAAEVVTNCREEGGGRSHRKRRGGGGWKVRFLVV